MLSLPLENYLIGLDGAPAACVGHYLMIEVSL